MCEKTCGEREVGCNAVVLNKRKRKTNDALFRTNFGWYRNHDKKNSFRLLFCFGSGVGGGTFGLVIAGG